MTTKGDIQQSLSNAKDYIQKSLDAPSLEQRLCFAALAEAEAAAGLLQMHLYLAEKVTKKKEVSHGGA